LTRLTDHTRATYVFAGIKVNNPRFCSTKRARQQLLDFIQINRFWRWGGHGVSFGIWK